MKFNQNLPDGVFYCFLVLILIIGLIFLNIVK